MLILFDQLNKSITGPLQQSFFDDLQKQKDETKTFSILSDIITEKRIIFKIYQTVDKGIQYIIKNKNILLIIIMMMKKNAKQ